MRIGDGVPTQTAWLRPGDCIKLAGNGPEIIFDPGDAITPASPAPPQSPPSPKPTAVAQPAASPRVQERIAFPLTPVAPQRDLVITPRAAVNDSPSRAMNWNHPAIWALGGAALLAAGIILGGRGNTASLTASRDTEQEKAIAPSSGGDSELSTDKPGKGDAILAPEDTNPSGALCLIIAKVPDKKFLQEAGTAFSLDRHHLVTSAGVARLVIATREAKLTVFARSSATGETLEIGKIHEHPEFAAADEEFYNLVSDLNRIYDDLEESPDAADQAELVKELEQTEAKLPDSIKRHATFDVAVLEVTGNVPKSLQISANPGKVAPGIRLSLWGFPIDPENRQVDPEEPNSPVQESAKLFVVDQVKLDRLPLPHLLQIEGNKGNLPERMWAGSPVLDRGGKVVGIYSRPTRPPDDQRGNRGPKTQRSAKYYVVDIQRLEELLKTLPRPK
ncbi:MAG: hypothetical protein EXS05_12420 [Planctomycetaceae bacterium]|nr:hypothetical protein [Planctomycetaceae bacterium]